MVYKLTFSDEAERDFELIEEFLFEAHLNFGESRSRACELASRRALRVRRDADKLARAPHQGTLHEAVSRGLRHVTINRAVYYFVIQEETKEINVIAIFFGGQDHYRRMLIRLEASA